MYYQKFIEFLKRHNLYNEEILNYWKNNRIIFDYREEEKRDLIGCYYAFKNNILTKINLIVPIMNDDKTVLINIHEYIHLYLLYDKIGKKCKINEDKEVLPIFYERLYIHENPTKELQEYYEYLNSFIMKEKTKEYLIALEISDILLKKYLNKDINTLSRKSQKLTKKLIKNDKTPSNI